MEIVFQDAEVDGRKAGLPAVLAMTQQSKCTFCLWLKHMKLPSGHWSLRSLFSTLTGSRSPHIQSSELMIDPGTFCRQSKGSACYAPPPTSELAKFIHISKDGEENTVSGASCDPGWWHLMGHMLDMLHREIFCPRICFKNLVTVA